MEVDGSEDLGDPTISSNDTVRVINYCSANDGERNASHNATNCENEPTSSQFLTSLPSRSTTSLYNTGSDLSGLLQTFVDDYNQRCSNFRPSDSPFSAELNEEGSEPVNYVESESTTGDKDRRVSGSAVERLMSDCETLRILNESPDFDEEERGAAGTSAEQLLTNSENIHTVGESPDFESDNDELTQNLHHNSVQDSVPSTHAFDSQNREPLNDSVQLFAPEDSSSSSDTSQTDLPSTSNLFSSLRQRLTPSTHPYLSFFNSPACRRSNLREDRPLFRYSPRYSRFSSTPPLNPLNLSSDSNHGNVRDSHLNLPPARRLSSCLLNRSRLWNLRYRTRSVYADLLLRNRTSAAALSAVSSSDGNGNLMERNDLQDLQSRMPFRRNLYLPRTSNEQNNCPISSSVFDSSRSNLPAERIIAQFRHRYMNPVDISSPLSEHASRTAENAASGVRARSVSPTSANPWFSTSVHDDSLDDTAVNFRSSFARAVERRFMNENRDAELPRPSTPLPPILSDDDSPLASNSFEDDLISNGVQSAPETPITSSRPANNVPSSVTSGDVKEVPHTYEELNSELIQLLECPICFEYSTPPINQCLQGHIICNNCRQRVNTCPTCRTMFQESRNLIVEKVAALLRYPCKNAVTGCLETLYLLQKEQHEKSCGFRHYVCFIPMCNWRGYKPELLVHVQETHENHVIHGATVNLMIPITGQTKRVWLMSAFNELFYVIFFATLGILKGCVRFIGDASKCDNFTYNISVTSEEEMLRNFNYTRTTHAYEETFENLDMIDSYDLFSISHAQLNLFRKGTKAPIRVTIEEAHMRQRSGLNVTASSNV